MKIQKGELLKNHTTFRIGGEARYFCAVKNLDEIEEICLWADSEGLQTFILGGGSNILFSDDGFDGLVIKIENKKLDIIEDNEKMVSLRIEAGVVLADLVKYCVENGYEGLEWAAGIPGVFSGAVRGNAEAFGPAIGDLIKEVEVIRRDNGILQKEVVKKDDCDFGYRDSFLKKNGSLIFWSAVIDLTKGDKKEIQKKFQEYIKKRQDKQPSLGVFPSAGSVFKNPVAPREVVDIFEEERCVKSREGRVPAGWLIDRCGLKGKKIGGAMVYDIQANFIVNTGNATFEDVMILISIIKQKVRNKFGIQLEEEIKVVI